MIRAINHFATVPNARTSNIARPPCNPQNACAPSSMTGRVAEPISRCIEVHSRVSHRQVEPRTTSCAKPVTNRPATPLPSVCRQLEGRVRRPCASQNMPCWTCGWHLAGSNPLAARVREMPTHGASPERRDASRALALLRSPRSRG